MRRFNFKLETVLKVRAEHEGIAKQNFAVIQRELAKEQSRKMLIAETIESSVQIRASQMAETSLDVVSSRAFEESRYALQIALARSNGNLAEIGTRLESARSALIEAQKKLKVLEKLKEQKLQTWKFSAEREEQLRMDEFSQLSGLLQNNAFGVTVGVSN